MAWSDAARRAALEVRRLHKGARQRGWETGTRANDFDKRLLSSAETRKRIARNLRAFRVGGKARTAAMKLGYSAEGISLEARISTAARNALRLFSRRR